jgi:CRP-like cAMP-binding protein
MRFKSGPIFERLAAGIIAAFMICYFATLIANTLKVLSLTLINPVARLARHYLKKKHSQKLHHFNEKDVIATLSDLPLFGYFSDDLLVKIVQQSTLRQYTVNAPVIVQGSEGRHLFCLLNGKLQIQKQLPSGRQLIVGDILPPSLFGEVAVIEESPRSASVIATKDSVVLEIPAHLLKQVADDAQYIRELESFRNAIMVNQFFTSAPVFRELDQKIVQMFISKGKIETYDPDQVVFKQGDRGDEFYLILRGSVGVSVNGHPITRIQQGGFFGEISMIADVPRTGTIYARESVQALKVSRDSFWEILSHDINIAMFIESVGEMRVREDIDIIRAGRAKVS